MKTNLPGCKIVNMTQDVVNTLLCSWFNSRDMRMPGEPWTLVNIGERLLTELNDYINGRSDFFILKNLLGEHFLEPGNSDCSNADAYIKKLKETMFYEIIKIDIPLLEFINFNLTFYNVPRSFVDQLDRTRNAAFWEQCLTGNTKISLLSGEEVPIKDLVGRKDFWVYSCTPEGKIVPGHGHSARITKQVSELVYVTLDNGEVISCTPEHPFMLRDGSYKEAQYLNSEDSLMPLYRKVVNHRVYSINLVKLEHPVDVYDITVDTYNNFALTAGVFVHNSIRVKDLSTFADSNEYFVPPHLVEDEDGSVAKIYRKAMYEAQENYRALILAGLRPEEARGVVPMHINTRADVCINMRTLIGLFKKRLCCFSQGDYWRPVIQDFFKELFTSELSDFRCLDKDKIMKMFGKLPCDNSDRCPYYRDIVDRLVDKSNPICPIVYLRFMDDNMKKKTIDVMKSIYSIDNWIAYSERFFNSVNRNSQGFVDSVKKLSTGL